MNAREVNELLAIAGLIDPRMRRTDEDERFAMSKAWAEVLSDVEASDAADALRAHYRESRDPIMPSDIVAAVGVVGGEWESVRDLTAERHEIEKARALETAGVSPEEFAAREHDLEWVRAKFGHLALESGE